MMKMMKMTKMMMTAHLYPQVTSLFTFSDYQAYTGLTYRQAFILGITMEGIGVWQDTDTLPTNGYPSI